jgi:hypothetical protein
MNYYELSSVSNSDLTALRRAYYNIEDPKGLERVFAFGSLVDAMRSEQSKLNPFSRTLTDDYGIVIYFEIDIWRFAEKLAKELDKDPVVSRLSTTMVGQYVFNRTLNFEYEGSEYSIRARCKFDGFSKQFATGLDYKTLSCATDKQFRESIAHFDYDRQAAWYMDLARIDYFWIIGISKVNGKVFKYAIERGSEMHLSGVQKYSRLAFNWVTLVDGFNQPLKLVA